MATVATDDVGAKRARDEDMREEGDARGWSSAIPDRALALRRRRGNVSSPFARATISVPVSSVPAEEQSRSPSSSTVLRVGRRAEEHRCIID